MKTLNEIEPRTVITNLPYTITNRGSYYLTRNLTGVPGSNGIIISSSDVNLDLNGFSIIGTTNSGSSGIVLDLATNFYMNLSIRNGIVSSWANAGVVLISGINCRLKGISAVENGLQGGTGIYVGKDWEIEDCIAFRNYSIGMVIGDYSRASNCRARENGGNGFSTGIGSVIEHCISAGNKQDGFFGQTESVIQNCVAMANTNNGIYVGPNSIAINNLSTENGGCGITAGSGSRLEGNLASLNQGDGIWVSSETTVYRNQTSGNRGAGIRGGQNCRIEANHATSNIKGFEAMSANIGNLFIANSAVGNATNYLTVQGANFGQIVATNSLGTNFLFANPWANFDLQ